MTTIAYDGQILAVDSKQTIISDRFADAGVHCPHCNKSLESVYTFNPKMEVPKEGTTLDGAVVLAWAWAGNQRTTDDMRAAILSKRPFDPRGRMSNGTLVILTDAGLVEARCYEGKSYSTPITEFPYAAGSGKQAALVAMKFMGSSSCESIKTAATVDISTGGEVYFYNPGLRAITQA